MKQLIEQQNKKQNRASVTDWVSVITWLLLGGVFLCVWPAVAYASIFAFDDPNGEPWHIIILPMVMGIWCYPVVYITCLITCLICAIVMLIRRRKSDEAVRFYCQPSFYACLPMLYVCIIFFLFMGVGAFMQLSR